MTHKSLIKKKSQAGFTLVELAIVMIIIGLLIGGVLKGQELIGNAEIAATSSQVEAFNAATTTFRDIYDGMPGDLANAIVRVPNCGDGNCVNGGGNGFVDDVAPGAAMTDDSENEQYWVHLHFADLLGGIDPLGTIYPDAEVDGSFTMGYHGGGVLGANDGAFRGHYATIVAAPGAAAAGNVITASQAARLDRKLDDGISNTGSVFTDGTANDGCGDDAGVYLEGDQGNTCDLFFRVQ